ncbi:MAG: chromosome segregation protein [Actinomycetia bacterium]|nr:chromosome segregation protein [Actinomycetes bacterium]
MRPIALELEGFAAFRERTTVDFRDADLFAIVGATGHGKSTLIDAISFALYGKVPRHGERDIAPVMTLGCNETRVSFTFELAGASYIATRILRRKASGDGANTRALRLELLRPDGGTDVLAGAAREFQPAMQKLVGLDFEQFTKCVVLPQGQFASFLHARAGDRVAILSALLDLGRYDRMATAARERAKRAAGAGQVLVTERTRLGDATTEAVDRARLGLAALDQLRVDIDASSPRDVALAAEIEAAKVEADSARRAGRALSAVRVPDSLRRVVEQIDEARAVAERAAVDADAADGRAMTAQTACDEQPLLDDLRAAATAHTERATVADRVEKGEVVHAARTVAAQAAMDALVAARGRVEQAQADLEGAQHRHAHATLRASLHVGEPCPVCDQDVAQLPPKLRAAELDKARRQVTAAKKDHDEVERAAQDAHTALTQSSTLLDDLKERVATFDARVGVYPDPTTLAALIETVAAAHAQVAEARAAATSARRAAQEAAKLLATFDTALTRAEAALQEQRDAIVAAGLEPPRRGRGALAGQWDALAAWANDARPEHEKRAAELDDLATANTAEREATFGELLRRAIELGVTAPTDQMVAALTLAVAGAQHDAAEALRTIEGRVARATELDADIAAAREEELLAAELGKLLDKGHFGQWLVDEALRGLVAGASELLDRLSGGQYALTSNADGELLVVDRINADETRSVRSLSGGETFQASLALALALADRIADLAADGAATLESIFLDEGFGTLDPETLDIVAGTIESLGSGERVVGIVTHVPALAERMPVRLRVRKVGRTSTVTREDA